MKITSGIKIVRLSHGILSYFGHVKKIPLIEVNLKMAVYLERKTSKR